jgi:hypothetical protein
MSFLAIVFIVLMMFWLFFGCWWYYEPGRPYAVGHTIIPWLCVAILGYVVFSGGVAVVAVR